MASNEYCFVAHWTFHCTPYITHQIIHGLYDYYSVNMLHPPCKMQLNDVIKCIGWYWTFVALLIQIDITT